MLDAFFGVNCVRVPQSHWALNWSISPLGKETVALRGCLCAWETYIPFLTHSVFLEPLEGNSIFDKSVLLKVLTFFSFIGL